MFYSPGPLPSTFLALEQPVPNDSNVWITGSEFTTHLVQNTSMFVFDTTVKLQTYINSVLHFVAVNATRLIYAMYLQ